MMAAVSNNDKETFALNMTPENIADALVPVKDKPLHFRLKGNDSIEIIPYFEVQEQAFTCFPALSGK